MPRQYLDGKMATSNGTTSGNAGHPAQNLILYWHPQSNHSRLVNIVAEALGVQLERREVDLLHGQHKSAEFMKINPSSQVPTLIDGDLILSESASICRYLLHKYPSKLYPLDNLNLLGRIDYAAEYIRQKAWDASGSYTFQRTWGPKFSGKPTSAEVLQATQEKMDAALNRITEVWFREHAEHVVGTELSLADIVLAVMLTHIVNMAQFDLSAHPKLQKFVDGLKVSVKGL